MKIETDDWVKLSRAAEMSGLQQSVAYRTAHRLGIVKKFFGVYIVRRDDVPKIAANKLHPGWQWQADPMLASECAHRGVDASLKARGLKRVASVEQPPKRPRGRPRKHPRTDGATTSSHAANGTAGRAT